MRLEHATLVPAEVVPILSAAGLLVWVQAVRSEVNGALFLVRPTGGSTEKTWTRIWTELPPGPLNHKLEESNGEDYFRRGLWPLPGLQLHQPKHNEPKSLQARRTKILQALEHARHALL